MPERFFQKVSVESTSPSVCWLWTGTVSGKYGVISRPRGAGNMYAHRYSYLIHYGEHPGDLFVCHSCDTPLCVRPTHLFLGDASANMADRDAKGRANHAHKLVPAQVREIRERHAAGEKQKDLAAEFGVSASHLSNICTNLRFRHLSSSL